MLFYLTHDLDPDIRKITRRLEYRHLKVLKKNLWALTYIYIYIYINRILALNDLQDLFVCLFRFYGISTFVGYLIPNLFLYK